MTDVILETRNLKKSFGKLEVLKGISTEIRRGEVVSIIGPSGGGKSTFLRCLNLLETPDGGQVLFKGQDITDKKLNISQYRQSIGMVFQHFNVFPNLTVLENLKIGAYLRKDKDGIEKDIRWVYDLFPRLQERHWQQAGTLSGGEQQMLAVGRALMSRPKLLMLDEPSLGLAPLVVQGIFDIIRTVNQQGMTVLLIEQNANMALKIADYAYVLETGCITKSGTGAELLADESIKEAYLGKKKK